MSPGCKLHIGRMEKSMAILNRKLMIYFIAYILMLISFIADAVEPNANLSQDMQAKIAQVQDLWKKEGRQGGSKTDCIIFLADLENFLKRKYKGSLRDLERSYQNAYLAESVPACPYENFETIIHILQDLENDKNSFSQSTYNDYINHQGCRIFKK